MRSPRLSAFVKVFFHGPRLLLSGLTTAFLALIAENRLAAEPDFIAFN